MHQQRSILNFSPRLRLSRTSGVTSSVLKKVTMGFGAFIQSVIRLSAGGRFRVDHSRFHSARSNPVSAGKPSAGRADGDKHGDSCCFPLSFIVQYATFCIARSLRRDRFAPYRKQTYVTAGKQSRHIRRNAASLFVRSRISRDSCLPRRAFPSARTLCSPSLPESCNRCTAAHILTRS